MRLVVLISGEGRNLQALIDACAEGRIGGRIARVISSRAEAPGLARAVAAGIPAHCLPHERYPDRERFDQDLAAAIDEARPGAVLLAGFMRILTPAFVEHFQGRLLNIHPSLLPKYPGLHTHRRVLEAGDQEHGATVHFVTSDLDGGPLIVRGAIPVRPDDTERRLAERVMVEVEQKIYPRAAAWFAAGRLALVAGRACLDGRALEAPVTLTGAGGT